MQTFCMEADMAFKVIVPSKFLRTMRETARAEDASEFLRKAEEMYPEDDDEFILMILTNGLKRHIRDTTLELLQSSGIGGRFAPVKLSNPVKLSKKEK